MRNFKLLNYFIILILLSSCGTLKDGFISPKKDNSDEFLVEKKMPLKMPPKFNELPTPKTNSIENQIEDNTEIKSLITKKDNNNNTEDDNLKSNQSITKSLLKKIKEN
tara:strand:- start:497 stop:820 length:324 start_codon:yes stop_codon:yes gene_type:complete